MEINNTIQKILRGLGTIVLIVLAALPVYYNRTKTTSLEIKKISEVELTRPLNVARLTSSYLYDSIRVEHLWQTSFVIKNVGENTLYGEGFDSKNIRNNALGLEIKNCDTLLSVAVMDNTVSASLKGDSIQFVQWRPNEYIELLLLSDGQVAPEIIINDRDIQNATISYDTFSPKESLAPQRFVDRWPKGLSKVIWWIVLVFEILSLLVLVLAMVMQLMKASSKEEKKSNIYVFVWILIMVLLPMIWMF